MSNSKLYYNKRKRGRKSFLELEEEKKAYCTPTAASAVEQQNQTNALFSEDDWRHFHKCEFETDCGSVVCACMKNMAKEHIEKHVLWCIKQNIPLCTSYMCDDIKHKMMTHYIECDKGDKCDVPYCLELAKIYECV